MALPVAMGIGVLTRKGGQLDLPVPPQLSEPPAGCYSADQLRAEVLDRRFDLVDTCWPENPTLPERVHVQVKVAIDAQGTLADVKTGGDDARVTYCVAREMKKLRFSALGCAQRAELSLEFTR